MKRKLHLWVIGLIVLAGLTGQASAQERPLSDHAVASAITCGPGNDFYLAFGHSALRIQDTAKGIDYVYNYGTFDFDTPHFYWNFARGMLNYCLSRTRFENFLAVYDYEQRWVSEQRLNLTPQEVSNLFVMLEWNYLPENRYYQYDFFRDNCATRVRDMVEGALGKKSLGIDDGEEHSYRRWVYSATSGGCLEWWVMGVDMLLGLPTDLSRSNSEAMFYPVAMMQLYDNATINGESPLITCNKEHLADHREPLHRSFPPTVAFALLLMLAAVLTVKGWWRPRMDRILFIIAGAVGLFLCFMWFGTDHWCTKWNLNILWASPLLILIAIRLNKSPRWALWLQEGCFAAAAVWVIACGLSLALIPIILTIALRVACLIPRKPQQRQPQR